MSETLPTRAGSAVREIDRAALSARLTRGESFKLVMASSDWGFRAKHIPGSVHFKNSPSCSRPSRRTTTSSSTARTPTATRACALIEKLREHGYEKVAHYAGGLIDWEEGGLPVEGDWAAEPSAS